MSNPMPTLFDDEEFFVPPPKKEAKPKKAAKTNAIPEEEIVRVDVPPVEVLEDNVLKITSPDISLTENVIEPEESVSEAPEASSLEEPFEESNIAFESAIESENSESAIAVLQNTIDETEVVEELVQESEWPATDLEIEEDDVATDSPEIALLAATEEEEEEEEARLAIPQEEESVALEVTEDLETASAESTMSHTGISFEFPDEDEVSVPEPLPIPGIKEEKVSDLDQLYRTEMIIQDYSAYAGFQFETPIEKKRLDSTSPKEDEIELDTPSIEQEAKLSSIEIPDVDPEHLDFELDEEEPLPVSKLPEFNLEDKYYTIGEVAALFEVNVSHIRFWTSEFKLKVRTTRKGDRLYNPENIARLRLIHHLVKENKHTLKGAKEKLKTQKRNVSTQIDLKEKLTGLKDKLERIKRNL